MAGIKHTRQSLQDTLQAEFCPPLDTSLLAALVAEIDLSSTHDEELASLRTTLSLLAKEAEDDSALSESFRLIDLSSDRTATDETDSALTLSENTTTTSNSSFPSPRHLMISSSPLAFLRTAFPHLPIDKLLKALNGQNSSDLDMEFIVEELLTEDYIRELEERGIIDETDPSDHTEVWTTVNRRSRSSHKSVDETASVNTRQSRKQRRAKAVPLVDIRQKQHILPPLPAGHKSVSVDDPWAQITSLCTYLSTLLPGHPESFFKPFFHSPTNATPATAVRAALASISAKSPDSNKETSQLFNFLEIVCTTVDYENLNNIERTQIMSDAEMTLSATLGQIDSAFDLVMLLRDLDMDSSLALFEMGVYHSPVPKSPSTEASGTALLSSKVSTVSHAIVPPPKIYESPNVKWKPPLPANKRNTDWQTVAPRSSKPKPLHPLSDYIPAYNPNNVPKKKSKPSRIQVAPTNFDQKGDYKSKLEAIRSRRNEALREASRYWQRGNAQTRGGEVAFFFADRARQIQEEARKLSLDAARDAVTTKRLTNTDNDVIDLHGTIISEAFAIVSEVLNENWVSQDRPLKIITGRGSHSTNRIGVLKPAIKNALEAGGWSVQQWDGGLTVRGKQQQ